MEYLRIPNWNDFQHYKQRNPPWIKLHTQLLANYNFSCLQDASKAHLILIWLLRSQCEEGIPNDAEWIQKRIGSSTKPDIKLFIKLGFLECYHDASTPIATCISQTETEGETETEREIKNPLPLRGGDCSRDNPTHKNCRGCGTNPRAERRNPRATHWQLPDNVNTSAWEDFEQHRQDIRKPLTDLARAKAANFLSQWGKTTQQEIVDASIRGRWTGLFPPRQETNGNGEKKSAASRFMENLKNA